MSEQRLAPGVYRRARSPYIWIEFQWFRDDATGKRPRIRMPARYAKTPEDAADLRRDIKSAIKRAERGDQSAIKFLLSFERFTMESDHNQENPYSLHHLATNHPASKREKEKRPREYRRHQIELNEFVSWSKIKTIDQLTLGDVERYMEHMRAKGFSYDGRRHRLLHLRRACAMAPNLGIPNVLAGISLNQRESQEEPETYSITEMMMIFHALRQSAHSRAMIPFTLGAFCGLRCSEIIRANVEDLEAVEVDGRQVTTLKIGRVAAKTKGSVREIPLPDLVAETIRDCLIVAGNGPLVSRSNRGNLRNPVPLDKFATWMRRIISQSLRQMDQPPPVKPPAVLRASFLSFAGWELSVPPAALEAYVGHTAGELSAITSRHYLRRAKLTEFMPIKVALDEKLPHHFQSVAESILQIADK